MNVLFYISELAMGGHVISSIALAKELQRRGHKIVYASADGPLRKETEKHAFKWYSLPLIKGDSKLFKLFLRHSPHLLRIITKESIDIVHNQETSMAVISEFPAILKNVPCITTIAGGTLPAILPVKNSKLIVFSMELLHALVKKAGWTPSNIYVIPNRIDTDRFKPRKPNGELAEKLGINKENKNILIMSRFEDYLGKMRALSRILNMIPIIYSQIPNFRVFIVGHGSKQHLIEDRIQKINRQIGEKVINLVGAIHDPSEFFCLFDLVFALGRSALESMSCGIPTMILGAEGFGGLACKEKIDEIAFYNFSGRNARENSIEKDTVITIINVMKNFKTAKELSTFSRRFVVENYDVENGARKVERLYHELLDYQSQTTCWVVFGNISKSIYQLIKINLFLVRRKLQKMLP